MSNTDQNTITSEEKLNFYKSIFNEIRNLMNTPLKEYKENENITGIQRLALSIVESGNITHLQKLLQDISDPNEAMVHIASPLQATVLSFTQLATEQSPQQIVDNLRKLMALRVQKNKLKQQIEDNNNKLKDVNYSASSTSKIEKENAKLEDKINKIIDDMKELDAKINNKKLESGEH